MDHLLLWRFLAAALESLVAADVLLFMLCCCKDHFCCFGVSVVFIVPADHRVLLVSMDVAAADLVLAACLFGMLSVVNPLTLRRSI